MIGLDNVDGPYPALDDVDLGRLLRALAAAPAKGRPGGAGGGAHGEYLRALASGYHLSVRSVYRYEGSRLVYVDVAGYRLAYLCRPGQPPHQVRMRQRRPASERRTA